jgi:multiple antibiotic resistance protein
MEIPFHFTFAQLISLYVTLLALVNPFQKIFVMLSLEKQLDAVGRRYIALKSNLIALIILLFFLALGNVVFAYVFNIQLYAFRITCGLVLLYNGFIALHNGILIKIDTQTRLNDIAAVPIALPMIAGPGTITAVVTLPQQEGVVVTILAILAVVITNTLVMLNAQHIGKVLNKLNLMSPMIRILGLIIATVGVQMCFSGLKEFIELLP